MTKPTLVAIYARVSTGEQNPEAQLLALREYASRRGFSTYLANARAKGKSSAVRRTETPNYAFWRCVSRVSALREIAHREERSASGVLQILRRAAVSGGPE